MNAPKCKFCNDTGMSYGSSELDCTRCDAATERLELNDWTIANLEFPMEVCDGDAWAIYQRGKAAGAAVPHGYALVPVDPTPAMLNALLVYPDFVGTTIVRHSVDKLPDAYKAMLAAVSTKGK